MVHTVLRQYTIQNGDDQAGFCISSKYKENNHAY